MKTMETTEEVSSDGMEKRVERRKCQRIAPFAREKPRVDGKKDLQICGGGRKSEKRLTLIVGKQSNGKSRLIRYQYYQASQLGSIPMAGVTNLVACLYATNTVTMIVGISFIGVSTNFP
jgi:hypothetical protein